MMMLATKAMATLATKAMALPATMAMAVPATKMAVQQKTTSAKKGGSRGKQWCKKKSQLQPKQKW